MGEPLLLKRRQGAVLLQPSQLPIQEFLDLHVFLSHRDAGPVLVGDATHDFVVAGSIQLHLGQRRKGVEDTVHGSLRQRQVGGRMVVIGLVALESLTAGGLDLFIHSGPHDFAGRAELDAEHPTGHVVDGLDRVLVVGPDQQGLRGLGIGDGEQDLRQALLGVAHGAHDDFEAIAMYIMPFERASDWRAGG